MSRYWSTKVSEGLVTSVQCYKLLRNGGITNTTWSYNLMDDNTPIDIIP